MRKGFLMTSLVAGLMLLTAASPSLAGLLDMGQTVQGIIVNASEELITVQEVNDAEMRIAQIDVEVGPETVYEAIASSDELKAGDIVKVEYEQQDEKNVATLVVKLDAELPADIAN